MDKTAIKNFAIWARNKLKSDIKVRAGFMGITESGIASPLPASTSDIQYFDVASSEPVKLQGREIEMRRRIVSKLEQHAKESGYQTAYDSLIENMASEWFNRLIAIRYMEVNDYFSDGLRMLSSVQEGKQDPDIVSRPFDSDLEFTDAEKNQINDWMDHNKADNLFRLLLLKRCNQLAKSLPGLFEEVGDASEFFLRLGFVEKDGFVYKLVHDIEEDDWKDQVQIIGWMYQYYNSEFKDQTFAELKKTKSKVKKEQIAPVTQLFTPDWIVRYMVENSLGRIWLEGHPDQLLKDNWKYYLDEAEQESDVQIKLDEIKEQYASLNPEDLTFIDPCSGSGHILVYAFEILVQIYESKGYSKREAAKLILEHNLYGIDIDERAYQLTYFALMMKAREYNKRILDLDIHPNVYCVEESNPIARRQLKYFGASMDCSEQQSAIIQMNELLDIFNDAKEYGSILIIPTLDFDLLRKFTNDCNPGQLALDAYADNNFGLDDAKELMNKLIDQAIVLSKKYWVTCTNPPYMAIPNSSVKLQSYVLSKYEECKPDLATCFIKKCNQILKRNGFESMITQQAFMFNSRYKNTRSFIIDTMECQNLLHLGARAFDEIGGEVVQTATFVFVNAKTDGYIGKYLDLQEGQTEREKESRFLMKECPEYLNTFQNIKKIDGMNISYWLSEHTLQLMQKSKKLNQYAEPRHGLVTGSGDTFMRLWFETSVVNTSFDDGKNRSFKWYPYCKGGTMRRWYGNRDYVVNWKNDGFEIINYRDEKGNIKSSNYNLEYNFRENITWSDLSTGKFSARFTPMGSLFDTSGPALFVTDERKTKYILGLMNSNVMQKFLDIYCTGLHYSSGSVGLTPIKQEVFQDERILQLVQANVESSKRDWDSYESSWDFDRHPLISVISKNRALFDDIDNIDLSECYMIWKQECADRFLQLKKNEEEINRIFIDIYALQDELLPYVADKDVTVHSIFDRKSDIPETLQGGAYVRTKKDEISSFLSYTVGCMFGRYSLNAEGLVYAGDDWDISKYSNFLPDEDNVIPITDQKYMDDDIVERLCEFLKIVYGEKSLETNLDFIANALGGKGVTSREVIRNYFLIDFFKDHCKTYQKRPIYWLFDSGKQNGFKALVYMHRWDKNSIGRVLVYLHKIQEKYEIEVRAIDAMLEHMTDKRQQAAEEQRRDHLLKQIAEIKEYDESLDHMTNEHIDIDLDDGVKVNYEKVQTDRNGTKFKILAPIK